MDVSQILLAYFAITIAWPFLVLLYEAASRKAMQWVGMLPNERWLKLLDSIGDKTIFAGLALLFGALFSFIWKGAVQLKPVFGGINLLIIGYILVAKIAKMAQEGSHV